MDSNENENDRPRPSNESALEERVQALEVEVKTVRGELQVVGVVTIVLTAGKLLVFDLVTVPTILRVALFMGFGAAMLVISYYVPKWTESAEKPDV